MSADADKAARAGGRRFSLSTYLLLTFTLCIAAVGALVAVASVNNFRRERERNEADLHAAAQTAVDAFTEQIGNVVPQLLTGLAATPEMSSFDRTQCEASFSGLASGVADARLHLFDPDGRQVCSLDDPRLGAQVEPMGRWFEDASAAGGVVWEPSAIDTVSGHPAIEAAIAVRGADGRSGVLLIVVYGGGSTLTLEPGMAKDTSVIVLDESGSLVLSTTPGAMVSEGAVNGRVDFARAQENRLTIVREGSGTRWLFSKAVVPQLGWQVLVGRRESLVLEPAWSALRRMVWVGLGALLAIAVLGIAVRQRIARPIRALERVARRTAEGHDDERAVLDGPREVGRLGQRLNELLDERQAREADLRWQALHDVLTGLPNRTLLAEQLAYQTDRAAEPCAVLFIDLDRFKLINDTHGHPIGDQLLAELANRLAAVVRDDAVLGRFGGDEFLLLCPGTDAGTARAVAQRMIDVISLPFHIGDHQLYVTASVGIAMADQGSDPDEVVANADTAMYRAKAEGTARIANYDESMRARTSARLALERDLHLAFERGELALHFQPVIDLTSGDVARVEALMRWNHAERGQVSPNEFIPIAEENGLIVVLGEWAIAQALSRAMEWSETSGRPLPVAVNVAAAQINTGDFAYRVERILEELQVPGSLLAIEVTESTLLQDPELASRTLRHLRSLGVKVSLDDFGTGYSSLSYLQELPLDAIKIDRSFVCRLDQDETSQRIVRAVIELASAIGLEVVGEGVESAAQLDTLRHLGCAMAQGFLLSHPRSRIEVDRIVGYGGRIALPRCRRVEPGVRLSSTIVVST